MKKYPVVHTDQYKQETVKWLSAIKRQENVSVIFVPKTDRFNRVAQLIQDRGLLKQALDSYQKYIFLPINFDIEATKDLSDIQRQISDYLNAAKVDITVKTFDKWVDYFTNNDNRLILILQEAEVFLSHKGKPVLPLISQVVEQHAPLIRTISFFETDFVHPSYISYLPSSTRLYENIYTYPLYTREETIKFIIMLERYWDIVVPEKTKGSILDACGGHFWLVKQAVREVFSYGNWKIESEGMIFRLRTIYNLLLPSEQSLIKKKILGSQEPLNEYEQHSLKHLTDMRVFNESERCVIDGFSELLTNPQVSRQEIIMNEGKIHINNVPVDKLFSRKELRVMKLLLERSNNIVSREEIAKKMWPTNTHEKYSDWAIDQLISRLRKRLKELSLSPKIIQVIRGQGYRLSLTEESL